MRTAGWTQKFRILGGQGELKGYLRVSEVDGRLTEIQVDVHKEGTMSRALLNAWSMSVNIGLAAGVPLKSYLDAFRSWRFDPSGPVECSEAVTEADSILDYIVRELQAAYPGQAA